MKKWTSPELVSLNVSFTNAGGYRGKTDGTIYQADPDNELMGMSGPPITKYPVVN